MNALCKCGHLKSSHRNGPCNFNDSVEEEGVCKCHFFEENIKADKEK